MADKNSVNLKTKVAVIYDYGLFIQLAITLSKYFKRVLYHSPWKTAYPKINDQLIGTGLEDEGVERLNNFWDYVSEDKGDDTVYIFPDVLDGDMQLHLESLGKRVWGSRKGEELELLRMETKEYLKELGLPVQPVKEIQGMDRLRAHLKKQTEPKYIKIDTFRGSFETFKAISYRQIKPRLDEIELLLGPYAEEVKFIVENALDDDDVVELAYDGYSIDGKFPDKTVFGYEVKGCFYVGTVKDYKDLSPIIKDFNKAISPALEAYRYRNFSPPEIRVGKDKIAYMIDFCARFPSPPSELYHELLDNLGDIIWFGAEGILIQPAYKAKYAIEAVIHSDWAEGHWQPIYFPKEIRQWVKLRNFMKYDGDYYIVPYADGSATIGAVVAIGNSLDECIKKLKAYADQIEGYRIEIETGSLESAQEYIKKGEAIGIKF